MSDIEREDRNAMARDIARFTRLMDICSDGMALCRNHVISHGNPALLKLVDQALDDICGCRFEELVAADVRKSTVSRLVEMRAAEVNQQATCRTKLIRADGAALDVDVSVEAVDVHDTADQIIVIRPSRIARKPDQLSREELHQLAHIHRMATFGELTASLFHELGQPLTAAHGAGEILLDFVQARKITGDPLRSAEIVAQSTSAAARKFQRIWDFIRQKTPDLCDVDVAGLLSRVLEVTETAIRHAGIRLHRDLPGVGCVRADESLVETALASVMVRSMTCLRGQSDTAAEMSVVVSRPSSSWVEITISHNGDSLTAERQLMQGGLAESKEMSDTLTIAAIKTIVEASGGVLSVEEAGDEMNVSYRIKLPASPDEKIRAV